MRKTAAQRLSESRQEGSAGAGELLSRARELVAVVAQEAEAHPFRTAGFAASAGFVLGGGLFTPLTGKTLRAGIHLALRFAVLPSLTKGLAMMGARLLEDSQGYGTETTGQGEKS